MSLLLALDTATPVGSVAVGENGGSRARIDLGSASRHSESLLPAIHYALAIASCEARDLTAIVVGAGPGSFTGIRIASATARGLARALGVPLLAYSSLLVQAASALQWDRPVCALFDARRGEVYAACYRFNGAPERPDPMLEPIAAPLEEVIARVAPYDPVYVGDGALRYADRIDAHHGSIAPAFLAVPGAAALLWLAHIDPGAGRVAGAARWEPEYLRAPAAERGIAG